MLTKLKLMTVLAVVTALALATRAGDHWKKQTAATRHDQRGFSSLEWALIAAGVVAIAAIIIAAVGGAVQEALNNI